MLNSISWQQYLLFLLVAIVFYYFGVWVTYFREKRHSLFRKNEKKPLVNDDEFPEEVPSNSKKIIEEIRPVFVSMQNRNELIYSLHTILKKYNQWDEPGFREEVNEFILSESEAKCSIHLSENDLSAVWL